MSLETLEQKIKAEYNIVHAFIALHPTLTILALVLIGWCVGRIHFPF